MYLKRTFYSIGPENDLQRTLVGLMVNVAILNYWVVALQQLSMQSADLCSSVLLPPSASLELVV